MKNERILSLILLLLVVIVGLQSYYIFGKKNNRVLESSYNPVAIASTVKAKDIYSQNPFEQMQQMQKEMDKIFNNMTSSFSAMPEFERFFSDMSISPSLNIEDKKDSYEINMNIPGSDENSIKIVANNGVLNVEAKTKKQSDKKSSNFIQKEIYEGSFVRSVTLPKDANTDKMSSEYKNGVLKITIPKKT